MTNINTAFYGASENIIEVIPWQSWPEKTQGVEKLSVTLTPSHVGSVVEVSFQGEGVNTTSDNAIIAALFIDDEQYAREAVAVNPNGPNYLSSLRLEYDHSPGDTLQHTYRIRLGNAAAGAVMRMNGTGSGAILGGASKCRLKVKEA